MSLASKSPIAAAASLALLGSASWAQAATVDAGGAPSFPLSETGTGAQAQRVQQQRLDAIAPSGALADVLAPDELPQRQADLAHLPVESPCFQISKVELKNNPFDGLEQIADTVEGQCVGAAGLKLVQDAVANEVIARGFITSRVSMPAQSLSSGVLQLEIAPGQVANVRTEGDAIGSLDAALPLHRGDILDQHAIDQGLETIRRLPSQADARFDIVPGARANESDIVLHPGTAKRWSLALGYDNAGARATGKDEISAALTVDSPLGLYDQFQAYGLTNADRGADGKGSDLAALSYSVPLGHAMLGFDFNQSNYLQTNVLNYGALQYSGTQKYAGFRLSGVVQRNARSRTELSSKIFRKTNHNFVSGTSIGVQDWDAYGYEIGASHRRYFGNVQVNASVAMRGTLPRISRAPGHAVDNTGFDGREQIESANVSVLVPFRLAGQPFSYQMNWSAQNARTSVVSPDYFTIGTRYSVRGFDQQATLAAESGWTLSNELDWYAPTPRGVQALYLGVDVGRVRGPTAKYLAGDTLAGLVAGVKGTLTEKSAVSGSVNYDLSVGVPLYKPHAFPSKSPTVLLQLNVLV